MTTPYAGFTLETDCRNAFVDSTDGTLRLGLSAPGSTTLSLCVIPKTDPNYTMLIAWLKANGKIS